MTINLSKNNKKRVVIVGGGFSGLALANKLDNNLFQVVVIDKNNYHQFQPLIYQVASAGLEPESIMFPFRGHFRKYKDTHFRLAEVLEVRTQEKIVLTTIGEIRFDYLILATGTDTNFFGNRNIQNSSYPMKTLEEALILRNSLLSNFEAALDTTDPEEFESLMNIVIVGGGATGVEIAGALSEMKKYVLPRDYKELNRESMSVYLIEGSDRVLGMLSKESSEHAQKALLRLGVKVVLNRKVTDYVDNIAVLDNGERIKTRTLIWVSGVTAKTIRGMENFEYWRGNRIVVDCFNMVVGSENIYAIGDSCIFTGDVGYEQGHPQVAPVAIQQGCNLADNLKHLENRKPQKPFIYVNRGSMATIGRNRAVADIGNIRLHGFTAWAAWLLVHLKSILGVRNKLMILIDWLWNYITYDRSARFILFVSKRKINKD